MNESVIEWYTKQILEYKSPTNINGTDYILIPVDKIEFLKEQSKEMEKEKIVNAWDNSTHSGDYRTGKEYYEETFKSE